VNIAYKLTTHAYGYVTGEFDAHSLVAAPVLAAEPRPDAPPADPHYMNVVWEYLTEHNMLFQDYRPCELPHAT